MIILTLAMDAKHHVHYHNSLGVTCCSTLEAVRRQVCTLHSTTTECRGSQSSLITMYIVDKMISLHCKQQVITSRAPAGSLKGNYGTCDPGSQLALYWVFFQFKLLGTTKVILPSPNLAIFLNRCN